MTVAPNDLRASFMQECEDLLEELASGLRALETATGTEDTVHAVFRAVHSIKGGAAAFGMDALVTFAHHFETLLDRLRTGALAPEIGLMQLCHKASDHLADLVSAAREGGEAAVPDPGGLLDAVMAATAGGDDADAGLPAFQPMALDLGPGPAAAGPACYRIRLCPRAALYASGNDPVALVAALAELGTTQVRLEAEALPPLDQLDPLECWLSWNVCLSTEHPRETVEAVFEFVDGLCALDIAADPFPTEGTGLDEMPAPASGAETPLGAGAAPAHRVGPAPAAPPFPIGVPLPPEARMAAPGAPVAAAPGPGAGAATIRVNLDRLDRLINLVGELSIKESMLAQALVSRMGRDLREVSSGLEGLKQLSAEIQESVMAIRAQPVRAMFQRMHRIVRETGEATGKPVRLVTRGEECEVDKTVIERLIDPLTHMIRNAIDHGLEGPQARSAAGKPEMGTVILAAAHRSGRVIIEISDDGAGIDRDKVLAVAVRRGLVPPDTELAAGEIDNLLFLPGFSSRDQVSALSGRGVGLDVVKNAIGALGGRVSLASTPGEGTVFSISLPLTLAVLEGMIVEVAGQTMVVPVTAIQETLQAREADIHPLGRSGRVLASRGALVPVVDLGETFGYRNQPGPGQGSVLVVVEVEHGMCCALVVDRIHDQRQVVIKSLEDNYGSVPGIAAATILGDGRIALIIDPEEIGARVCGPAVALTTTG